MLIWVMPRARSVWYVYVILAAKWDVVLFCVDSCHILKVKFEEHLKSINLNWKFKWKCVVFMLAYIFFCIDVCFRVTIRLDSIWIQFSFKFESNQKRINLRKFQILLGQKPFCQPSSVSLSLCPHAAQSHGPLPLAIPSTPPCLARRLAAVLTPHHARPTPPACVCASPQPSPFVCTTLSTIFLIRLKTSHWSKRETEERVRFKIHNKPRINPWFSWRLILECCPSSA